MPYPLVGARWYTAGPRRNPIRLIVLHTTEGSAGVGAAAANAAYCARRDDKVSSHYVVDATKTIQCVHESDIAYCAVGSNHDGVHIEMCGRAGQGVGGWASAPSQSMIGSQLVPLIADICRRNLLPAVFVTAEDMRRNRNGCTGVTTHAESNRYSEIIGKQTTGHTDPGADFPMQAVLQAVRALLLPIKPWTSERLEALMWKIVIPVDEHGLDCWARLLGVFDERGMCAVMTWLDAARYDAYHAAQTPEIRIPIVELDNVTLIGPLPVGDQRTWVATDFFRVVA